MAEGFFRSKKGFTVVQNEITRDNTISLKAKRLISCDTGIHHNAG